MFLKFMKKFPALFILSRLLLPFVIEILLLTSPVFATTILVTSNDGGPDDPGTLYAAILNAQDGDIIDCSPIAGQTIYIGSPLPAIVSSLTILGSGVTVDGGDTLPVFSLAQGSAIITDFIIQNGLSQGGQGGSGHTGAGGGTGGGGALYIHSGSTLTIFTMSLNNNQAIGGAGGAGATGGSGGGGGGFGGGRGGTSTHTGATAGASGGGGGNNGGALGGTQGAGSPNTFSTYAGAGGGGEIPGPSRLAGAGGSVAATSTTPARSGGGGGLGSAANGAGAGGGAGSGGSGGFGSDSIDEGGTGVGGNGGLGVGADNMYGAGGGGGGGNGGGAGYGTSGGGGGLNGPGGSGGALGGGGGASGNRTGGNGGFGAGGGAGFTGGVDTYGLGGAGGSAIGAPAGGGGGSGLGGAIFVQKGGLLIMQDNIGFFDNSTTAGIGGTAAGSSGEDGSSLGQDIFIQSGASVNFQIDSILTMSTPIEGAGLLSEVTGPGVTTSGLGTVNLTGVNTYLGGTLIQSGILNLNGSINGDLNIESAGTLSGNATVNGNVYSNGTIWPGLEEMLILGSLSLNTTDTVNGPLESLVHIEIDSSTTSSVSVAGSASLAGTLQIDLDPSAQTGTYIILTSSAISGTFDSVIFTGMVPTYSLSYLPIGSPTFVQFDFLGYVEPPSNLQGKQIRERIQGRIVYTNILRWAPPTSGTPPAYYNIYRSGVLIGTVPADSPLIFEDSNRALNVVYTYEVVSVSAAGNFSTPALVTVNPIQLNCCIVKAIKDGSDLAKSTRSIY